MRKDVRKNFKKLEKEVWIKQTQQWKKEFLATLTDRMMNSCNMLNEYFVTNSLPNELHKEINSKVGEALSGESIVQGALEQAAAHLKSVEKKATEYAKAKVLTAAHTEQLAKMAANWQ